ncbi:MAG: hypothetical protein KF878_27095 [Planctomycetes bacterium]|nr:hypothetical protein [Planctomycetota bacterium]
MASPDDLPDDDTTPDATGDEPLELDAAGLRAYVLGSLALRGSAHDDLGGRVQRALGWYRALAVRGAGQGVLFSWVYDLGHLLIEGDTFAFRSQADLGAWSDDERAVRLEHENRLLNGVLRDPSARLAIEWLRQDASRDDLVARVIELLLQPLVAAGGHARAPALDPVLLRELSPHGALDPRAESQRYDEVVGQPGALLEAARSSLRRFFARRGTRPALGPDDLVEVEHWSAYKRAAQRLAGRRIAARAADFPRIDPKQVTVVEEADVETELPDSGYYPQGGFAELSTRGALENLVPTELVYMGEDPFGADPDPAVDLFAIRNLEAETLYFQRDSGQLRRTRRTVHVAVAPDDGLRLQLRWHSDPLAVLVYALVVRLSEDLGKVFQHDAVRVEVHLLAEPGHDARVTEDAELLRVLLRHEVARGAAAVHVRTGGLDLRGLGERARRVYGVAVAAGDRRPAGLPDAPAPRPSDGVRPPRVIVWQLGGERPQAAGELPVVHTTLEGPPTGPLVEARRALLGAIAGIGGRGGLRVGARGRR